MSTHQSKTSFFVILILLTAFLGLCFAAVLGIRTNKVAQKVKSNSTSDASSINAPINPTPEQVPTDNTEIISGSFDQSKMKSEAEWKKILTQNQYIVLREAGTETPFTGPLLHETRKGTYYSVGCDEPVFRSEQKYDSQTGWPSFWAPVNTDALVLRTDKTIPGESRVEVLDKCGNHLGHVFDDGPQPTGKRYCMNSLALKFVPDGSN